MWPRQLPLNKFSEEPLGFISSHGRGPTNTPFVLTGSKDQAYIYACRVQRVKTDKATVLGILAGDSSTCVEKI